MLVVNCGRLALELTVPAAYRVAELRLKAKKSCLDHERAFKDNLSDLRTITRRLTPSFLHSPRLKSPSSSPPCHLCSSRSRTRTWLRLHRLLRYHWYVYTYSILSFSLSRYISCSFLFPLCIPLRFRSFERFLLSYSGSTWPMCSNDSENLCPLYTPIEIDEPNIDNLVPD